MHGHEQYRKSNIEDPPDPTDRSVNDRGQLIAAALTRQFPDSSINPKDYISDCQDTAYHSMP